MTYSMKLWGEILQIISGKKQTAVEDPNGPYPIYGSGGTMGFARDYLCEAGTTIIGRKGTINNPIFVTERFWNVDTAFGLAPGDMLHPKYLYYFCVMFNFKELDKSTTIPSLAKRDLLNIKMPVPPLPEQERIVANIEELFSELDKAVETLRTTKQQLAVYRQAVAKDAYEGKFTYGFESRCEYFPLAKLGKLARGKSKHRPRNDPLLFKNGAYPFVQTGEIKAAGKFITKSEKFYNEVGLAQSQLWPVGTLCITIAANIAETAFLGIPACFPDSVVGFTPGEKVLPEYVRYFIESQKLRLWAYAPATAQKNINLKTLENLLIPYCSLPEQKEIVAAIESRLSVCDSIEQTVDAALQQADALRQSTLKEAFERRL